MSTLSIVQLGLIAYQPGGAAQLAEALEDIFGHQKMDSP
jgi:hypothetical protein